ncbi:MAG: hypothetical protein GEU95_16345 [Rhizobiales bacterium]|nr:hypothetical protein [Hyphomicrobiales bacterium]
MKILISVVALAVALGWPAVGEAQGKKAGPAVKARSATGTHQHDVQRRPRLRVNRSAVKPCAARTWAGCQGWDPDPNVRMMIQMDAGRDDQ